MAEHGVVDARWQRVKHLYRESRLLADSERDSWLERECADDADILAEVRDLLATPAEPFLDAGAIHALHHLDNAVDSRAGIDERIGAYRLIELIGEGGMGTVFLAERDEPGFAQRVALKRVRSDGLTADARASFLRERNVLARLVHPNIAQLHDGGVADDGAPYFTLEYVSGEPITRFCDGRQLDLRARLRLVLQVCAAVEYAHRNLVVHRDLKPSNILVTAEGDVKLLDFGIAKLLDPQSQDGLTTTLSRRMTPQYAAPEQVLGEAISTATDVYAIGVLLYELCGGRLPYARAEAGAIGWAKAVVADAPETLHRSVERDERAHAIAATRQTTVASLRRSLRGDLDYIVRHALEKNPEQRYASVAELAADLHAHLSGRPIGGGSRAYRCRLFVRRHWLPLGAAAAVALMLVGSSTAVLWQARERERAAQTTIAVKDFLYGLFTAVDPREAKGRNISARELVDRGAARIERATMDPAQRAEIEATLGRLYYQLGAFDRADALQNAAEKMFAADPTQAMALARIEAERAETLTDSGDFKAAMPLAISAAQNMRALGAAPADLAKALHAQARLDLARREFKSAKIFALEELGLVRNGGDDDALYGALTDAGGAIWGLSEPRKALGYFDDALQVALRKGAPDDLDVAKAQMNRAISLQQQSRYGEALQADTAALAIATKILGPDHPMTLAAQRDMGLCYHQLGEYAKANTVFEQLLAAQRAKMSADNPAIAAVDINYGILLTDAGDLARAEAAEIEARDIFEKKYGHEFQGSRIALGNLALVHMREGRYDEAAAELGDVESQEKKAQLSEGDRFMTTHRLGELARLQGDAGKAIELERRALAATQAENGDDTRFAAAAHYGLGLALRDAGDGPASIAELRSALHSYGAYIPQARHPLAADVRIDLARLLLGGTEGAEARRLLDEAVEVRKYFFGADDPRSRAALELAAAAHG